MSYENEIDVLIEQLIQQIEQMGPRATPYELYDLYHEIVTLRLMRRAEKRLKQFLLSDEYFTVCKN